MIQNTEICFLIPKLGVHNRGVRYAHPQETSLKGKRKMTWLAAASALLAPMCRNSQKGVKKLLMAAAADKEGLQHCNITIFL